MKWYKWYNYVRCDQKEDYHHESWRNLVALENPQFMPVNRVDGELVANLRLHYARR